MRSVHLVHVTGAVWDSGLLFKNANSLLLFIELTITPDMAMKLPPCDVSSPSSPLDGTENHHGHTHLGVSMKELLERLN